MKRHSLRGASTAVLLLSASTQASADADLFLDVDVSLGLDDNVTRAQENIDIEHDVFVSANGTFGTNLWRGRQSQLNGSAGLGVQQFDEYDGLDNASLRLGVDYVITTSAAFGAPWYAVNASYTLKEFRSFLRDSDIYVLGVTVGKQIDDLTSVRSAINFKVRESDGNAFDTQDVSWFVNIDWSLQPKTLLYTTYKLQVGDTFSTASDATAFSSGPGTPWLAISSSSVPKDQPDDVFGGIVYRLDSTTHIVTLGLNLKNNLHSAWDISLRLLKSETDIGLEYEDLALTLSYFHKFGFEL